MKQKKKNHNTEFLKIKNIVYEFKNRLEKQEKRQISGRNVLHNCAAEWK